MNQPAQRPSATFSFVMCSALAVLSNGTALAQPVDAPPSQPGNPQIRLYAGAGGEVFWQRSTDDSGVSGYEITRNGVTLGIQDVLSVYDPSLLPDTPYLFTIAAVDTTGQRSPVATVSTGEDTGNTSGDPAIAPANLSLQVYSGTAAELFWEPATFIDRNEIRRDGELIATRSGGGRRSFFDDTREPGRTYTYEVTAINGLGQGSAIIGEASTPGTPTIPDGATQTGLTSIGGDFPVQLAVYDAQSFELSWDRIAGAASYRLQRDGQTVQESGGISRYVSGIDSSATFAYTLTALDATGQTILSTDFSVQLSASTQLMVTDNTATMTPGPSSDDTLLGPADAPERLLPDLLAIVRGEPVQALLDAITLPLPDRSNLDAPPAGFTLTGRSQDDRFNTVLTYDCTGSGTATVVVNPAQQDQTTRYDTDSCVINGTRHSGNYAFRQAQGAQDKVFEPVLEVVSSSVAGHGRGAVRRVNATALPNGQLTREANALQLTAGPSAGLVLSGFASDATYNDQPTDQDGPQKRFTVGFDVNAPWTGGQSVQVRTISTFGGFDRTLGTYTSGSLEVLASDGSRWLLTAANGDPATFQLDITSGNDMRSETLSWNENTVRLPCVSADGSADTTTEALQRCESTFGE